jgi:hypothetical protein
VTSWRLLFFYFLFFIFFSQLVARSDVLVAVHGAALGLLPFLNSAKNATVLELLPHGFGETDFYGNLARSAGVRHLAISANHLQQPAAVLAAAAPMESALAVDTEKIIAQVRKIFPAAKE